VSVAVTLKTVVSVGRTRLLSGMGLGAGRAARLAIVVVVVLERLMRPASGSVPVFTDQRSTPHAAMTVDPAPTDTDGRTRASARPNAATR
jgi:hypothetical protein